jgi:hypothetical protein
MVENVSSDYVFSKNGRDNVGININVIGNLEHFLTYKHNLRFVIVEVILILVQ